ncbi:MULTISPECIES: VOC family protein [Nocardioides]|uniref:VOC family protein n=1 Tax=Nocardioides TaxID=1839 RepID=UPI0004043976|nr:MULTISPECIES: VOC family protein [Nocardioides]
MATFESYQQGTPSWIEYSSADQPASKEFYSQLFGWDYDDQPMNDDQGQSLGTYSLAKVQGDSVAGLGPAMAPGQPASWGVYLATDDVDASVEKARQAGGQVHVEPMDVPDQGRMAWIQDPGGASVGLWQEKGFAGSVRANEPGTNIWNELTVADPAGTGQFYSDVLGLQTQQHDMGPDNPPYTTFNVGDKTVAGTMALDGDMQPHWNVYFNVDDVDAAVAKAEQLGASVVAPAMDVPGQGRFGYLRDPQGATFNLMQNAPQQG